MAFIIPGLGVFRGFPRANAGPSFSSYSLLEGESSHFMEGESKAQSRQHDSRGRME